MEDNHTKKELIKLGKIRMSNVLRTRMREELGAFADFHPAEPVREGKDTRLVGRAPEATLGAQLKALLSGKFARPMIAALIAVLATSGTAFAAQGTIPGDLLYPVKIHVNENIRSAIAVSSEAEARLQAELLEERIKEANKLAAEGALDVETSAAVTNSIESRYDRASKALMTVETRGDVEAAADVQARLDAALRSYVELLGSSGSDMEGDSKTNAAARIETLLETNATTGTSVEGGANIEVNGGTNVGASLDLRNVEIKSSMNPQSDVHGSNDENDSARNETTTPDTNASLDAEVEAGADASVETGIVNVETTTDVTTDGALKIGL